MAVSFVGWGISGDLFRLMGPPTWIAKVGGQTIEIPAFQTEYQRDMARETRGLAPGQDVTADMRRRVGQQALAQLIDRTAIAGELKALRIVTPDDALAAAVRTMPAFRDSQGAFSHAVFTAALQNAGYSEDRFLARLRGDIAEQQLLSAVGGSAATPVAEIAPVYAMEFEKRSVDMATFVLSTAPEPAAPDDADLQRWYENHPDSYVTPEYRRIKAVELSAQSVAPDVAIGDADLQAAYQEHKSDYEKQATRSAEVISAADEATATALATTWRGGADWVAIQAAAKVAGASGIAQNDATQVQFPDPDLAAAVFSAPVDTVSDPVKGKLGWFVVKVTKASAGGVTTFDQARDALRARVLASKAADLIYDRANKLDQLLGNGTSLDDMPSDLGLAGVAGTMDAKGDTQAGVPAPIPGPVELKTAIVAAAFKMRQGDPPQLTEVQTPSTGGSAYFALAVESVIPPGEQPFDSVKDRVAEDWKQDQRHRFVDQAATDMMTAVQDGKSFSDAATAAGVTPKLSPLTVRDQGNPDIPPMLQRVMFGLKPNEATMVETPLGFVVAQLAEIVKPDAAADKDGYDRVRAALDKSFNDDLTAVFVNGLRERAKPQINRQGFDSIVQAQ